MSSIDAAIIKTLVEHISPKTDEEGVDFNSMGNGLISMLESRLKDIPHEWTAVEKEGSPFATLTFTGDKKIVPEVGDIFIVESSAYRFSYYYIVIDVEDAGDRIRYKTYAGSQFDTAGIYISKANDSTFDLGRGSKAPDDVRTGWFRPKAEYMKGLNPLLFYHILMYESEIAILNAIKN